MLCSILTKYQLLTKSSSAPLLENTCIHFISVILSTRGMIDGKDSYPVFHINPQSTLAHTVAKLVATTAHRYHDSFLLIYPNSHTDSFPECGWSKPPPHPPLPPPPAPQPPVPAPLLTPPPSPSRTHLSPTPHTSPLPFRKPTRPSSL